MKARFELHVIGSEIGVASNCHGAAGMTLTTSQRPVCILNGHSVRAQEAKAGITRIASEYGADAEIIITKSDDDISALVARAIGERREAIVAGGGDGTVNAVAGIVAGTASVLGIIPIGTLNHFAKDIGVPLTIDAAVRNLFTGKIAFVDVGEVNGRVFVNNSGIGFYPHFVRQREALERRGHVKRVAFMLAVRSIVRRYLRLRIKLHMNQIEVLEHVTPFLFVGNNKYQTSGPRIGTRLTLNSGRLWVCTAPRHSRAKLIGDTLRTLVGSEADQNFNAFETEELWVDPGTVRVNVSTDGEVGIMDAPLHYKIRARELRVIVPDGSAALLG